MALNVPSTIREGPASADILTLNLLKRCHSCGELPTFDYSKNGILMKREKTPRRIGGGLLTCFRRILDYSGTGRLLSAQICCTRAFNSSGSEEILATVNSDP